MEEYICKLYTSYKGLVSRIYKSFSNHKSNKKAQLKMTKRIGEGFMREFTKEYM